MERLTFKYNGHRNAFYRREHGNSMVDVSPGSIIANEIQDVLNKLSIYEDAEEQGLLIKLPCKVGDTVWWVPDLNDRTFVLSDIVSGFSVEYYGIRVVLKKLDIAPYLHNSHLFFSREEAEGMLKNGINVSSKGENNED